MESLKMYLESNRHYHNFSHIGKMLEGLEEHFPTAWAGHMGTTLRYAILYHDVVYIPGSTSNELASANVLRDELKDAGIWGLSILEAQRLILLTKDHKTNPGDEFGQVIIDLDLMGLASDEYVVNSERIRKEFSSLSDTDWRIGRVKWLKDFLARDYVFQSAYGRTRWEAKARSNMQAELEYLTRFDLPF